MTEKKKLRERVGEATTAHPWIALTILLVALLVAGCVGWYINSGKVDLQGTAAIVAADARTTAAQAKLDAKIAYVERLKDVIVAMEGEVPTEEVVSPSELQKLLDETRSVVTAATGADKTAKLKEAEVLVTKAIAMDAKSAEAWVLRAEIRRALGNTSWRQDLAKAKALNAQDK